MSYINFVYSVTAVTDEGLSCIPAYKLLAAFLLKRNKKTVYPAGLRQGILLIKFSYCFG
jgi:hypothetical protein